MAELYRHTDEDGYRVTINSGADGDLMVSAFPVHDFNRISAVDVPAVDGRRLLAALLSYYEPSASAAQAKREAVDG